MGQVSPTDQTGLAAAVGFGRAVPAMGRAHIIVC
jgi:hypothetical protein